MISAVERIYREVSQPASVSANQTLQTHKETPQTTLTREDVDAILAHKRAGTPEELQYALNHAKDFGLIAWQRDRLAVQLTIAIAARTRAAHGIRDANSFLYDTLRVAETPYGTLYDRD